MDRFLTGDDFAVVIENHSGAAFFFADYRDGILEIFRKKVSNVKHTTE